MTILGWIDCTTCLEDRMNKEMVGILPKHVIRWKGKQRVGSFPSFQVLSRLRTEMAPS